MPIITKAGLPANKILEKEGVKLKEKQTEEKEEAIQIAILNLMPMKEDTELQLLRKLSCTDKNVQITFVKTDNHKYKNVSQEHLDNFYEDFNSIKNKKWDGLIITGAPIELMEFEEVDYWDELKEIMDARQARCQRPAQHQGLVPRQRNGRPVADRSQDYG